MSKKRRKKAKKGLPASPPPYGIEGKQVFVDEKGLTPKGYIITPNGDLIKARSSNGHLPGRALVRVTKRYEHYVLVAPLIRNAARYRNGGRPHFPYSKP